MSEKKYIGLEDIENNGNIEENDKNKRKRTKVKKERKSIFERFSTKENIIIFSFLLVFIILIMNIISSYSPYSVIDYRKENSSTFIDSSSIEYDRDIYWIANEVVLSFLNSNLSNINNEGTNGEGKDANLYYTYSVEDYYNTLIKDYKKYLSKNKYLELAKSVISNYKENYKNEIKVSNEVPIKKIYKLNNKNGNYYLIELNTTNNSYIGIEIIQEKSKFRIFYLE